MVCGVCRQKRSMGLTLAEGELARLDTERVRDRVALERERACAENIITKIEDVLLVATLRFTCCYVLIEAENVLIGNVLHLSDCLILYLYSV